MGGAWVGLALGAVVLVLLLVFILENGNDVKISFFGAQGHMPLGVALLLAAALGVLLVVIPGTGRIIQLRRTARRHRKSEPRPWPRPPLTPLGRPGRSRTGRARRPDAWPQRPDPNRGRSGPGLEAGAQQAAADRGAGRTAPRGARRLACAPSPASGLANCRPNWTSRPHEPCSSRV